MPEPDPGRVAGLGRLSTEQGRIIEVNGVSLHVDDHGSEGIGVVTGATVTGLRTDGPGRRYCWRRQRAGSGSWRAGTS
jgi:hypothetical protein